MSTPSSARLNRALTFLFDEAITSQTCHHRAHQHHHAPSHHGIPDQDTWAQISMMRQLLCQRPPHPDLPPHIAEDIDVVLDYESASRMAYPSSSLTPYATVSKSSSRLYLWKGDITSLSETTAIVNAANSQMLGCFVPGHHCIDNAIHAAAGPRLRRFCAHLMDEQGHEEPMGSVKVTPGFNLAAENVLHTVGPQLERGQKPTRADMDALTRCYTSCLKAAESLPALQDGRRVVALCCVSAGLYAFPADLAAKVAVAAVLEWVEGRATTELTDIIFNVFTEKDQLYYETALEEASRAGSIFRSIPGPLNETSVSGSSASVVRQLTKARSWLKCATHLLITAGAGLSASDGLDYTSAHLFSAYLAGHNKFGLRRLYDAIGFSGWPSARERWGYFVTVQLMLRSWPKSKMYASLRDFTSQRFPGERHFVRTSNADGLFFANGFDATRISTPQGQYAFLQCSKPCRPDAVAPTKPFVDFIVERDLLDPVAQVLKNDEGVPRCKFCAREMTLCVRGGNYFTMYPFRSQEREYKAFIRDAEDHESGDHDRAVQSQEKRVVILELGVGTNTSGVLRWPDEDLVENNESRFKLIRVGIGAAGCAPWDLVERGLALGIDGDVKDVLAHLLET